MDFLKEHGLIGGGGSTKGWTTTVFVQNSTPLSPKIYDVWVNDVFPQNNIYYQTIAPNSPTINDIWFNIGDLKYQFDVSKSANVMGSNVKSLIVNVVNSTTGAVSENHCKIYENPLQQLYVLIGACRQWDGSKWVFKEASYWDGLTWINISQKDFYLYFMDTSPTYDLYRMSPDGVATKQYSIGSMVSAYKGNTVVDKDGNVYWGAQGSIYKFNYGSKTISSVALKQGTSYISALNIYNDTIYVCLISRDNLGTNYTYSIYKLDLGLNIISSTSPTNLHAIQTNENSDTRAWIFVSTGKVYAYIYGKYFNKHYGFKFDANTLAKENYLNFSGFRDITQLKSGGLVYTNESKIYLTSPDISSSYNELIFNPVLPSSSITGIQCDGNYLYIKTSNSIYKYTMNGDLIWSILNIPNDNIVGGYDYVSISKDGCIYVTDNTNNRIIKKYNENASLIWQYTHPLGSYLYNLKMNYGKVGSYPQNW